MKLNPEDTEAADMFRVMMIEMIKMHPAYLTLKSRIYSFRSMYEKMDGKMRKNDVDYHLRQLEEVLIEMKD